jgi:hypothetical protein
VPLSGVEGVSLSKLIEEWPDIPVTLCKGCGKKIVFAQTQDGKTIPLDPSPPVYGLMRFKGEDGNWVYRVDKAGMMFVSHFSTCPKAADFSGSKKP